MSNRRNVLLTLRAWTCLLVLTLLSCTSAEDDTSGAGEAHLGRARQAITDTDGDGMDDGFETTYFGGLSQSGAGDFDSDNMTNLEEYTWSLNPTVNEAFDDADGDRYPNIFEVKRGSDPNDAGSTPTPNYTVDAAGGGTHTSVSAAVNAASTTNGAYQIIGIAPGLYTGDSNLASVSITSSKPKLLMIGLQGADKTVLEGTGSNMGWTISNTAVVAGLTFRKNMTPFYLNGSSTEVRLADLFAKDNTGGGTASFAHMPGGSSVNLKVTGTTILNDAGIGALEMWVGSGSTATLTNTVFWGSQTWTLIGTGGSTPTTNYCLVKGATLTGTGNLSGTTDPKLRSDGHLRWDSPLRAAGGTTTQSRTDLDNETRPTSSPDIGVDQFVDSDSDSISDQWEIAKTGNLTTLTSLSQDGDSDGLTNEGEYAAETDPTVADTDSDGLSDGDEVNTYGSSPLRVDSDSDEMPDYWEATHGLSPILANKFDDQDQDGYPNIFEYARSSDPSNASSIPTPNYTVDASGGGTHTTVSAAVGAANVANGAYQIIGIAPGVYTGSANLDSVSLDTSSKPKLLVIGLQGADKTILDGGGTNYGWTISNTSVVASLTFRKTLRALYLTAASQEVRLVDLLFQDNGVGQTTYSGGIHVVTGYPVTLKIVGSTFLNNTGGSYGEQLWFGEGNLTLQNTAIWGTSTGLLLGNRTGTTVTASYSLVKGQTLTGSGNLAGTTDPKLRSDGHLLWDSPLRGAGGVTTMSRVDMDGELRPSTAPDIGVDQFNDVDSDQLADQWELANAGDLTTLTSQAQDADSDGASNDTEYLNRTSPILADTDGDGVSDGDEINVYGSNPLATDTDADGMPDKWEVDHGLSATTANPFEDADGDRYPNIFEYTQSTDPSDSSSKPTPDFVVDGSGAGTHTTLAAAVAATSLTSGAYQIIGIAPGTYSGSSNLEGVTLATSKPKLLVIGLEGAEKTIFDGNPTGDLPTNEFGWTINNAVVISSLTFRHSLCPLYLMASAQEVRFVDLLLRDNGGAPGSYSGGVHVVTGYPANVKIVGSTLYNNLGLTGAQAVWIGAGSVTFSNTVVWNSTAGTALFAQNTGTTLTANNSFIKGIALTGSGNLSATTDPKLRSDTRLRSDSPLRGAGGTTAQSRLDIDGELRPTSAPDIGVDQFNDADLDDLPDAYEIAAFGNIYTVDGAADEDLDGLTNAEEHDLESDWLEPDTDGDGVDDGLEVSIGSNPLVADSDDLAGDLNHDGLIDGISVQLGHQPNDLDNDGDSISNADELLMCTDPLRADTDGDGVSDATDKFPHDPLMSSLISNPADVTPPVITLESPWYAVEQ